MWRPRGYALQGEKLRIRGEFTRKPRVSLLTFIGITGMLENFATGGTFTRRNFFKCCRQFALESRHISVYPGPGSIWILDGAKIHCHPSLCFIYFFFGLVKAKMQRRYKEGTTSLRMMNIQLAGVMHEFREYSMRDIFTKCGYSAPVFDPTKGYSHDISVIGFE
ncbi:hypothetical protein BC829DRAFT_386838 [Chytridium lagenaria]|nr:hypothetical protein BC829DRAFT_386838 [Chytridium lagenaria]